MTKIYIVAGVVVITLLVFVVVGVSQSFPEPQPAEAAPQPDFLVEGKCIEVKSDGPGFTYYCEYPGLLAGMTVTCLERIFDIEAEIYCFDIIGGGRIK